MRREPGLRGGFQKRIGSIVGLAVLAIWAAATSYLLFRGSPIGVERTGCAWHILETAYLFCGFSAGVILTKAAGSVLDGNLNLNFATSIAASILPCALVVAVSFCAMFTGFEVIGPAFAGCPSGYGI